MGRSRGQQNDRLYIKRGEYDAEWGGKQLTIRPLEKPIPFKCCALSLQPFIDPVCTSNGITYDIIELTFLNPRNIVPWLKKYKIDPYSGAKLVAKDLVTLHFHQNAQGHYHCPVTCKEFTDGTHIVAIRTTGNVYCYEAVAKLNIEPKIWKELLTEEAFSRADIIDIYNPANLEHRRLGNFYYIKHNLKFKKDDESTSGGNMNPNSGMVEVVKKLNQSSAAASAQPNSVNANEILQKSGSSNPSTAKRLVSYQVVPSLTATHIHHHIDLDSTKKQDRRTKKKGRVQLLTNLGLVDITLHCDWCPKTCENFLTLCETGYYDGIKFHRSIKNFMIQGGCPEGTGHGGRSIWDEPFEDEIIKELKLDGRGVVAMANRGHNTNGSQFFILYKSAKHLDGKHTVFGKISQDSMNVLNAMECIDTVDDVPIEPISIIKAVVIDNPLSQQALKQEKELDEIEKKRRDQEELDEKELGLWFSNPSALPPSSTDSSSIGKYIKNDQLKRSYADFIAESKPENKVALQILSKIPEPKKNKVIATSRWEDVF